MATSKQISSQRRKLRWAQHSKCAGCGNHLPGLKKVKRHHPDYPTFDHFIPKSRGGGRTLGNGLLKHLECNQKRGDRDATGCDRVWFELVKVRLPLFNNGERARSV